MKICKLCRKEKELKRSHIIPEFMYRTMYDDKHNYFVLSSDPKKRAFKKQKGEWEKLLCSDCETQLSRYERYVSFIFNGGTYLEFQHDHNVIKLAKLNYLKFKLFQLSIIWRASISSRKIFNNVQLGKHEEIIRKMLLNKDPGGENQYGCILRMIFHNDEHFSSFLVPPDKTRVKGDIFYQFAFNGFWWHFNVASHKPSSGLHELFLKENGTLLILKSRLKNSMYFRDLVAKVFKNDNNKL